MTKILIVSSRKNAYGLERAKNASIETRYHNLIEFRKTHPEVPEERIRPEYDVKLAEMIKDFDPRPDIIVCAGWMHILAPTFLDPIAAEGIKIINLHPALPKQFDGTKAIERAWQAGREGKITKTGVMIHYVIEEIDRGAPICTQEVELKEGESLEDLETRIHEVEHVLIVEGTRKALSEIQKEGAEK